MYSLNMLAIAMELARHNRAYEDVASKFWEHFLNIAHAMSGGRQHGGQGHDLWDDEDGFFYDVLHTDDQRVPLKVRSLVGLIPLLAVQTLEAESLQRHEAFRRRRVVHRAPPRPDRERLHADAGAANGGCSRSSIPTACAASSP